MGIGERNFTKEKFDAVVSTFFLFLNTCRVNFEEFTKEFYEEKFEKWIFGYSERRL